MLEAFAILREHDVQVLTVGQYLRPSESTCRWSATGTRTSSRSSSGRPTRLGFESVASGPLVRSSYHADESAREVAERRASTAT